MSIERFESGKRMSQAVVHNAVVYLAGQVGEPGADVRQQTQQALTEIDRLLALSGSSKSRLLTAQIWLSNMGVRTKTWTTKEVVHVFLRRQTSSG